MSALIEARQLVKTFPIRSSSLGRAHGYVHAVTDVDLDAKVSGSHEKATRTPISSEPLLIASVLDALHGQSPPLPYRMPIEKGDYTSGYDLVLVTGALFYGKDASRYVIGVRGVEMWLAFGNGCGRWVYEPG